MAGLEFSRLIGKPFWIWNRLENNTYKVITGSNSANFKLVYSKRRICNSNEHTCEGEKRAVIRGLGCCNV